MKTKYPRTPHLPWSSKTTSDDRVLKDDSIFVGKRVVVTIKMDGENTTMYEDGFHARSLDSNNHFTRNWVKGLWGSIAHDLKGIRICGENMWAKHTISYNNLESYFYVISIWRNAENKCYSWQDTLDMCKILNLTNVIPIYNGTYDKEAIEAVWKSYENEHEGYVIRLESEFEFKDFKDSVAKYVKPKFKEDMKNTHWTKGKIESNKLNGETNI